jgi:hypothetical protein
MRHVFLTILIFLFVFKINAQNWEWVKTQGIPISGATFTQLKLGSSGNLASLLTKANGSFIAFSNSNGDTLWEKFYPNILIKDMCLDTADNIYFAGVLTGSTTINGHTFVSKGSVDAFIGMFNNSGNLVKYKTFGTVQSEYANSLVLNGNEVIVTGSFINSQMVDFVQLNGSGINFDTYIIKFSSNLTAINGFQTKAHGADGIKIAIDKTNSIYLMGTSQNSLTVGSFSVYLSDDGGGDGYFFAKFDYNLNPIWAKTLIYHWLNGSFRPFICFDSYNNIILGYSTSGGHSGTIPEFSVQKYDPDFVGIWGKGIQANEAAFIEVDDQDNVWVAGRNYGYSGPYCFSIAKISSSGVINQLIYDPNIQHPIQGFAVKKNNDFYLLGNCNASSYLSNQSCSPANTLFLTRYSTLAGMTENKSKNSLLDLYPNPSSGIVYLRGDLGVKTNCSVCVKNILGNVVYQNSIIENVDTFKKGIDLSSQAKGVYFVEFVSEGDRSVEKVVIQ